AEELNFVVTYVKYLVFQNFDSQVEEFLANDFEFGAAQADDTSRDFLEPDDLGGVKYSDYVYNQNFVNEDMDEYLAEFYSFVNVKDLQKDNKLDAYVFTKEADAQATLKAYNDRLEKDDAKLTFATLVETQNKVVRRYQNSIELAYGYDLEGFVKNQVESMIKSIIVAKYNKAIYSKIDGVDASKTKAALLANTQGLAVNQKADYLLNDSFDTFVRELTESSYLYAVDEAQKGNYIFVKNILVPFSAEQTQYLANLAQTLGGTESQAYLDARNQVATQIVADDFTSEKDADGEYAKVEGLFEVVGGKLQIKAGSALAANLQNGQVVPMSGMSKTETIIELMKRFNTDTAQHSSSYDYVVRIANDEAYTQPWVTEFVDAAKQAKAGGLNSYAVCVSSYGVHIVYYSADVEAQDFSENAFGNVLEGGANVDTTSPAYKFFTAYFDAESNSAVSKDLDELKKAYETNGRVEATKEFKKFMKDNEMEFTFEDLICTEEESEEEGHEGHNH
ncbi:MAG: hypothetical protein J6Q55_03785, partial [Clostridia bacterium]|nr:hypothetical protein [Clostridia bacterium]